MWKAVLSAALISGVLLIAATSRSDSPAPPSSSAPLPEPTTGTPLNPSAGAGSAIAQHDPFMPYDIGGPAAAWSYDDLTPEEQAAGDRAGDASGWDAIHNGYTAAVRERSAKMRAQAAAQHLGIDNLGETGVVP